jgi:hypothetical protein
MPGVLDLESIARGLLEETRRWFTEVAGLSLPERQHLAPGNPALIAWDCPQLTVAVGGTALGVMEGVPAIPDPIPGPMAGLQLRWAGFAVALVRCTPALNDQGEPPSAAELDAAGGEAMRDCGALSSMMTHLAANPEQFPWLPQPAQVRAGAVTQIGPLGALTGYQADLQVTVVKEV